MSRVIAPTSIDKELEQLLKEIDNGTTQLPEFQRSWIWDDYRIRAIIASISQGYPMGVIMRLAYGNSSARFQYRPIEGADTQGRTPSYLILDGQQRLTSIYCAAYSHKPVNITNNRGKDLRRFYYLDINKCLDENVERIDAVISVSDDKKGLETQEQEFEREMFPLNIIFDSYKSEDWADGYKDHHGNTPEVREKYKRFRNEVLNTITSYKLPVIDLDSSTSKEAVCKVFENVNTGGVVLTVFELVTASFAADDFNLREDWEKCKAKIRGSDSTFNTDLMDDVNEVSFLTAITLYSTFMNPEVYTSCARKDVLNLTLEDYLKSRNTILEGYELAKKFLFSQCIFRQKNLPYSP